MKLLLKALSQSYNLMLKKFMFPACIHSLRVFLSRGCGLILLWCPTILWDVLAKLSSCYSCAKFVLLQLFLYLENSVKVNHSYWLLIDFVAVISGATGDITNGKCHRKPVVEKECRNLVWLIKMKINIVIHPGANKCGTFQIFFWNFNLDQWQTFWLKPSLMKTDGFSWNVCWWLRSKFQKKSLKILRFLWWFWLRDHGVVDLVVTRDTLNFMKT